MGQRCDGTIVISKEDDKHNVSAADIMQYFQNIESEEDTQEQLRMNLLIVGHGKEMRVDKEKGDKLVKLIKQRKSIHYFEEDDDKEAESNLKLIKDAFPEFLVPETPVDFLQMQNDLVMEQLNQQAA
jgi:hypothetical protein